MLFLPAEAKVLVVDDLDSRHEFFQQVLPNERLYAAKNYLQAIEHLSYQPFDFLFLDHDLGEELDGLDIAHWLVEHPAKQPTKIIVHSMNPVSHAGFKSLLPFAEIIPFFRLMQLLR